jgi:chloramphenicol O-acetyltransferase type A
MLKTAFDIATWPRKDHFEFFSKFEEPFFGITADVDCTLAYKNAKETGESFFLYYLYASLKAANSIENFRLRIENREVYLYNVIHASPTINRTDGTFGFAYFDYHSDYQIFKAEAQKEIKRVQNTTGLVAAGAGQNVIHYSSLPWIQFTSVSHARAFSFPDSCPKITFGKTFEKENKLLMPVAVHVNHALVDGIHVGKFLEEFQDNLNLDFIQK